MSKNKYKRYDDETKKKAFGLYVDGKSFRGICRIMGIGAVQTISRWAKENNWEGRRTKILSKVTQKTDEKKSDIIAKLTDKHAAAAGSLIGIVSFEIDKYVRPIKKYIESGGGRPKINTHEIRRLTAILKDAIAVERQAYGLSMSDVAVEARIKKELFEFDRSSLKPKERAALDELVDEVAVLIEGGITANDNLEDYSH